MFEVLEQVFQAFIKPHPTFLKTKSTVRTLDSFEGGFSLFAIIHALLDTLEVLKPTLGFVWRS